MKISNAFGDIIKNLQKKKPIIHHITNYVTAESCADIALAAGASPIMADAPEEAAAVAAKADALVLNLGTFNLGRKNAMELAAASASKKGIPVILDPVGVMTSNIRLTFALALLNQGNIAIVRGNLSECKALLSESTGEGKGVDSLDTEDNAAESLKTAQEAAQKFKCVFAVTGKTDNISNGKQALVLNTGHPLLKSITGSGCMTSTLVACCASVSSDMLTAAALGTIIMGQSAELAANLLDKKDGPGTFKARLIDCVYHVTSKWELVHLQTEKKIS